MGQSAKKIQKEDKLCWRFKFCTILLVATSKVKSYAQEFIIASEKKKKIWKF